MVSYPVICSILLAALTGENAFAGDDPAVWPAVALHQALHEANTVNDAYRRAAALANIASVQIAIEDPTAPRTLREALAAAGKITEPAFQGWVLQELVVAHLAANDVIGARQTLDLIRSPRPRAAALSAMARMQLHARNVAAAEATASGIRDTAAAGEVQRQIVTAWLAAGELQQARRVANGIKDDREQALALGEIAAANVHAGDIDAANALSGRARKRYRHLVLGQLALAYGKAGDMAAANGSVQRIELPAYAALIQAQLAAMVSEPRPRAELFASAADLLRPLNDAFAWAQLARIQAGAGDVSSARESTERALALVDKAPDDVRRDDLLDLIARNQLQIGEGHAALATANRMVDGVTYALLVRDVIASQTDTTEAVKLVESVAPAGLARTAALFGVLSIYSMKQDRDSKTVQSAMLQTLDALRSMQEARLKPRAFAALAAAALQFSAVDMARAGFMDALRSAADLHQPEARAAAYAQIARALHEPLLFLEPGLRRSDPAIPVQ